MIALKLVQYPMSFTLSIAIIQTFHKRYITFLSLIEVRRNLSKTDKVCWTGRILSRVVYLKRNIFFDENSFQAVMYTIMICGSRNLRVIIGPLPLFICFLQSLMAKAIVSFSTFLIFLITLTKFMFVCVWKSVRQMNDKFVVAIFLTQAYFWRHVHIFYMFFQGHHLWKS